MRRGGKACGGSGSQPAQTGYHVQPITPSPKAKGRSNVKRLHTLTHADVERREATLDRLERITELPLIVLAAAMVPLLVAPFVWELNESSEAVVIALDVLIWALFAVDLAVKTAVAPRRVQFLRQHWLDVLVVLVPFARPLRLLRIIAYGSRAYRGTVRLVRVDFLAAYAIGLVLLTATAVSVAERDQDSQLNTFPDAMWWSVVTVTTVGYGDVVPVTNAGRAFAYVLMLGGIGLFGALTANLASLLMRNDDPSPDVVASLVEEIRALREEVAQQSRQPS